MTSKTTNKFSPEVSDGNQLAATPSSSRVLPRPQFGSADGGNKQHH